MRRLIQWLREGRRLRGRKIEPKVEEPKPVVKESKPLLASPDAIAPARYSPEAMTQLLEVCRKGCLSFATNPDGLLECIVPHRGPEDTRGVPIAPDSPVMVGSLDCLIAVKEWVKNTERVDGPADKFETDEEDCESPNVTVVKVRREDVIHPDVLDYICKVYEYRGGQVVVLRLDVNTGPEIAMPIVRIIGACDGHGSVTCSQTFMPNAAGELAADEYFAEMKEEEAIGLLSATYTAMLQGLEDGKNNNQGG
jgi:hypothetical protein